MVRRGITLVLLFCGQLTYAQENLLPNPSFEKHHHIPGYAGDGPNNIESWKFPNKKGAGDYYHSKAQSKECGTGQNEFGHEEPHSGEAYAGICIHPEYREFLQAQLITPLEKGKTYRFSVCISKADKLWLGHVKEFGVIFTKNSIAIPFGTKMNVPPSIIFYDEKGFTNSDGWTSLEYDYTAEGNEQWLTFGAFEWSCQNPGNIPGTKRTADPGVSGHSSTAHYYIDDISLIELNKTSTKIVVDKDMKADTATQKETSLVLRDLHFGSGSAILQDSSNFSLDSLCDWMKSHPDHKAMITGHTDNVGDSTGNQRLSEERSEAVKAYLTRCGIDPGRIRCSGYGESRPVAENETESGRTLNRRVEIKIFTPQH